MRRALQLGEKGDPSPNPHVGSVVADSSGKILGEGFHEAIGLDHAETAAIKAAGSEARGGTLYVTLEPCNHQGRTAPCVDAVLNSGIRRVVIGALDPNPNVPGGGARRLADAGLVVDVGVAGVEARALITPWTKFITAGLPHVSLKLALS